MADAQNLAGPPPDIVLLSTSYRTISQEVSKFSNLPQFDNGAEILRLLRQISQDVAQLTTRVGRLEQRFDGLEQRFDGLVQRFDRFETRFAASDHNSSARVQNSWAIGPNSDLSPLVNPSTGSAIENFPQTPRELQALTSIQLTPILQALGLPSGGTRPDKQRRLRQFIGMKPEAV